jgi:hypothetical protein
MASREAGTGRSPVAEAETERRLASRGIERVLGGWWRAPPPPPVGIGGEDAVGEVDTTILFLSVFQSCCASAKTLWFQPNKGPFSSKTFTNYPSHRSSDINYEY